MSSTPTSAAERDGAVWPAVKREGCWQCGAESASSLFCPSCNAIQPPPAQADYFQILGLPRRLVVDGEALQKRYYELNRRLHPDRYQTAPQEARSASLRSTAAVNQAYRTLRDPVDRGIYWLALRGEHLGTDNNRVPAELAALVFEVQEKLEELRSARDTDGHTGLLKEIGEIYAELLDRRSALLEQLTANFACWDAGSANADTLAHELKSILSALAYLGTLIRDVEKELEQ
jgi:molecular chaperone HscB